MKKILIFGAGSIGNHMSYACSILGHKIYITDKNPKALLRMKNKIYPKRYGKWDNSISLYELQNDPKGGFDLIIIGTPPHTHTQMAIRSAQENPKAILIEKPLCEPFNKNLNKLKKILQRKKIKCFIGYNHCLSKAVNRFIKIAKSNKLGKPITLDVESSAEIPVASV